MQIQEWPESDWDDLDYDSNISSPDEMDFPQGM